MSIMVVIVGMPLGRRNSILIGNILIFFGGIIQATTFSVAQIIVARVICVSLCLATGDQRYLFLCAR